MIEGRLKYLREIGHEPTVFFGVSYSTREEVIGPVLPRAVQYAEWVPETYHLAHALTFNFNKYRPDLPPWSRTQEVLLASENGHALCSIDQHIETAISGRLKTVHIGCDEVSPKQVEGEIISRSDVVRDDSGGVRDSSEFKVNEPLT